MSFAQRYLSAQFTLAAGQQFTGGGSIPMASAGNLGNQLTVGVKDPTASVVPSLGAPSDGLRMSARITRAGAAAPCNLSLDVWGMKLGDMNTLSTLGTVPTTYPKNTVLVKAGDASGMTTVFSGGIYSAYADLSNQPDVRFHCDAQVGIDQLATAAPSSWNGAVDVATILGDIAARLGVPFTNDGVSVILRNPKFTGSLFDQAQEAVDHAGIAWNYVDDGTLAIWLPGQARSGSIPLISSDTGLVGYPAYNSIGIQLTTVFNPSIRFGGKVSVQSGQLLQNRTTLNAQGNITSVAKVGGSGTWAVNMLNHRLESLTPNGAWFSDLQCAPIGYLAAPG